MRRVPDSNFYSRVLDNGRDHKELYYCRVQEASGYVVYIMVPYGLDKTGLEPLLKFRLRPLRCLEILLNPYHH